MSKDMAQGVVLVAAGRAHPALWSTQVLLQPAAWLAGQAPAELQERGVLDCCYKAAYRDEVRRCRVRGMLEGEGRRVRLRLLQPQGSTGAQGRAVTAADAAPAAWHRGAGGAAAAVAAAEALAGQAHVTSTAVAAPGYRGGVCTSTLLLRGEGSGLQESGRGWGRGEGSAATSALAERGHQAGGVECSGSHSSGCSSSSSAAGRQAFGAGAEAGGRGLEDPRWFRPSSHCRVPATLLELGCLAEGEGPPEGGGVCLVAVPAHPQWGVAPQQAFVMYSGEDPDVCLGCALITAGGGTRV